MIQIYWQNEPLNVNRLVFQRGFSPAFDAALDTLAARLRLQVADDAADPRPGDFWLGCHPRRGWGVADHRLIGWACILEVSVAIALLSLTSPEEKENAPAPHANALASIEPYTIAASSW